MMLWVHVIDVYVQCYCYDLVPSFSVYVQRRPPLFRTHPPVESSQAKSLDFTVRICLACHVIGTLLYLPVTSPS